MIELEGLKKGRSVLYCLDGGMALAITLGPNFSQNDLIINVPTKVYKHGHQPIRYGLTSISRFFTLAVKYKCDIRKKNGWTFSYPRLLHLNFHIQALKWNLKSFYSSA